MGYRELGINVEWVLELVIISMFTFCMYLSLISEPTHAEGLSFCTWRFIPQGGLSLLHVEASLDLPRVPISLTHVEDSIENVEDCIEHVEDCIEETVQRGGLYLKKVATWRTVLKL